jgi:cytochrome d ubiquinol oxidase subunit I
MANSFMQEPVGYVLRNGRAEMTDFFALVFNPHVLLQYPHVLASGISTAAFFVLGISAYHLLKKSPGVNVFTHSFRLAAYYGLIGTLMVAGVGHAQGQHMVKTQPMKMAAAEALWETESPAAFSVISIIDEQARKDIFSVKVPGVLSIMAGNSPNTEVRGIKDLQAEYEQTYGPGDYVPPVTISFWTFRIMVGIGFLMLAMVTYNLFLATKGGMVIKPLYLQAVLWAIALPYLANTAGWLFTEMGRQPWIVFGLQKTSDAVSPNVSVGMLLFSLISFTVVYGALMVADVYLLVKFAKKGVSAAEEA